MFSSDEEEDQVSVWSHCTDLLCCVTQMGSEEETK